MSEWGQGKNGLARAYAFLSLQWLYARRLSRATRFWKFRPSRPGVASRCCGRSSSCSPLSQRVRTTKNVAWDTRGHGRLNEGQPGDVYDLSRQQQEFMRTEGPFSCEEKLMKDAGIRLDKGA